MQGVPLPDWERIVGNFGLPLALIAGVAWLVWRYAPILVDAHVDFVRETKSQGERSTRALETLSESQALSSTHHGKTHAALTRATEIVDSYAEGTPQAKQVRQHTDEIRRILDS